MAIFCEKPEHQTGSEKGIFFCSESEVILISILFLEQATILIINI